MSVEVELHKGPKGLGIVIGGGVGLQYYTGDDGIYVTKIVDGGAAAIDGRISVGDRLVAIKNIADSGEDFYLNNCTQDDAIHALKRCKNKVILLIARAADSSFEEEVEV